MLDALYALCNVRMKPDFAALMSCDGAGRDTRRDKGPQRPGRERDHILRESRVIGDLDDDVVVDDSVLVVVPDHYGVQSLSLAQVHLDPFQTRLELEVVKGLGLLEAVRDLVRIPGDKLFVAERHRLV